MTGKEFFLFFGKQASMHREFLISRKAVVLFLFVVALFSIAASSKSPRNTFSPALRRYPYLTDVVGSYATINWATDRFDTSGLVRYGKVGAEACTAHAVIPTKTPISVNGVLQYQWKALLNLEPGTRYCYRVYLGTSPVSQIDLLGSDPAPSFWTQVPAGADQPFSFVVFGDWGYVGASGTNPYQANLMSLIAASGSRFAVTTGDNGYPDGNQKNFGDLTQTGPDVSAVFGPSFWKVPGASLPVFLTLGNHGIASPDTHHPTLITWPQDRAVATSGGRYTKETYCCLEGTFSGDYPSMWYAFDAGPARFYLLQTAWDEANIGTASEYQMDYVYHWAPGSPQWEWLKADLAAHPSVLKFAFFHYPLYSDNPFETASPYLLGSDGLEGLLKQYNVDIAFTGNAHIYERNLPSPSGVPNYITGGGGAPLGTLGTCTALDAYAIKFTTTGKACGSAPVPTSAAQVYHFLKVTVNGTNVTVTPINSLGQSFDVMNHNFTAFAESTPPGQPANLTLSVISGTRIDLSWSASTDNTRVRGYGIYRNGVLVDTVDKDFLSYSDTGLVPATNYVYRVDAFDGSGNHSTPSATRSATTQSTATYTFAPVADAFVAGDTSTTNYGGSTFLKADASPVFQSYLRFNVGDVSGTVTKATLRLYTTSSSATGYQIKRVSDQGWEEGNITFDNAPAADAAIGSSRNFAANNWTSVDVTSLVTSNGIYDFALITTSTVTLNFNSRDASSNRPQLVVETTNAPVVEQAVNVWVAANHVGNHLIEEGQALQASYNGVNNGPVKMLSGTVNSIVGSEAVFYSSNGVRLSFSELMGLPANQVDKTYWLPWYNNVDLDTQLRIANVSGSSATVRVFIAGQEMQGSPFNLVAGASTRKSFAGIDNGPVKIVSTQNIVAAERVIYRVNSAPTSFSEMMALPHGQINKTYWLPLYNNVDLDTQLRIANISGFQASVQVFIGGQEMPGSPIAFRAGQSKRISFAGINKGPVKIVSTQNIVAAERVIYKVNGKNTSFSETMALPNHQLHTTYWLPWYNNVGMDTQLRIANVSTQQATVRIFIGGQEMQGSPFNLAAGASTRKSFAGVNNGPVVIVSTQNIVAAERVIYKVNNTPTSFSEMIGVPNSRLSTTYWLPWYNNVDPYTELRFAVP
jgi:chitodextrinase